MYLWWCEKEDQVYHAEKSKRLNKDASSGVSVDASGHISDKSHKADLLVKNSINNSHSDLSDYASLTSSLIKAPKQLTNLFTHSLQLSQPRANSSSLNTCWLDKRNEEYYSTLESSNDQLYHKSPRSPYTTQLQRRLWKSGLWCMKGSFFFI